MNISMIGNGSSIYSTYLRGVTSTSSQTSDISSVINQQGIISNEYGDTLELSGSTQSDASRLMTYGPPRGGNRPQSAENDPVQSFLKKVEEGTVTEDDLANMQSVLQQMQQQQSNVPAPSNDGSGVKEFLDKVADGSVTTDDLKSMQTQLAQMGQGSMGMAPPPRLDSGSDNIKTFLDKVANGTVTDDDLKTMQSELKQMQEQSKAIGSESDRTNPNRTSLDTSNSNEQA
ncbi:MAG TPA: hypothetical protein VHR47_02020, partial [Bacillota bacterium]|nr:hypothetical protein [Bacillota bacterium]